MHKLATTILLGLLLTFLPSCQNSTSKTPIEPINSQEYLYFVKDYESKGAKSGYTLKEVYSNQTKARYQNQPAKYNFTASEILRDGSDRAAAILIKLEVDRLYTNLSGPSRRSQKTHYICVPASASPASTWDRYNRLIADLGLRDYEVYISDLTKLLAKLQLGD